MTRALLLLVLLVLPLAAADHVFSHRVVLEGRILGGNGLPLPDREVLVGSLPVQLQEPCPGGHQNVTDEWGDFWFCFHVHELRPGTATVVSGGAAERRELDLDLRRAVYYLRDPTRQGVAPPGWNETFHLDGRVWDFGPTRLDGVDVTGVTLNGETVEVTTTNTTRAGDSGATGDGFTLRTDGYGDYRGIVRLFPGERPEDVLLTIEVNGTGASRRLDTEFHRMTVDFRFPVREPPAPMARPGTTSPPVSLALVVGVGLAVAAAVAFARRK